MPIAIFSSSPTMSQNAFLRVVLQEVVPVNGADTDTLFTDDQIQAILDNSNGLISLAAWFGWLMKAGALAIMVDRNDGVGSNKKFSQASAAALKIAKVWENQASSDLEGLGMSLQAAAIKSIRPYDDNPNDMFIQLWDVSHIDKFWLPWSVIEG